MCPSSPRRTAQLRWRQCCYQMTFYTWKNSWWCHAHVIKQQNTVEDVLKTPKMQRKNSLNPVLSFIFWNHLNLWIVQWSYSPNVDEFRPFLYLSDNYCREPQLHYHTAMPSGRYRCSEVFSPTLLECYARNSHSYSDCFFFIVCGLWLKWSLYIYIFFLINLFSLYLKGRETERENTERSSVYWLTPTNAHNSQEWGQGKTKSSKLQLSLLCTWYLRLPAISQHAHLQGGGSEVKEQELKEASQMAT